MLLLAAAQNGDKNLTSPVTVWTGNIDTAKSRLVQFVIDLGDGAKNLDGTGGAFTVSITSGSQVVNGGAETRTLGTGVRARIYTTPVVILANVTTVVAVGSPNAGDSDVDVTVQAVDVSSVDAIGGVENAASRLGAVANQIIHGTVSTAVTSPSTTVFAADDITEATADHFNGRLIVFTSGVLVGQMTRITDYALDTGEGKFTVEALTEAPANDVTFEIQ